MTATVIEPAVDEDPTRRTFLARLAAAGLLVAYGADEAGAVGSWSFTDDRGVEVTRGSRPERVVAYDTAGSALWHLGITPVGIFGSAPLADNPNLTGVDVTGIESVGEIYGEVNLEKLAALRPDLIVTAYDPRHSGPLYGFTDEGVQAKAEAIAPVIAFDGAKDPTEVIGRFEELAGSLGADLKAPDLITARHRFDEAFGKLRAAIAGKPGLRAVALYAEPADGITFWRPSQFPGLRQFQQAGLDLAEPEGDPEDFDDPSFFGERVSFEQADKYPADLILFDFFGDLTALADIATWQALPAVQAGQIAEWRVLENWSYPAYAQDFQRLTEAVERANPDLVP